MLPVQDVVPSRSTPWVTIGLVAIIIGVFGILRLLGEQTVREVILSYGLLPAHLSWTTLVTSVFLHYGAIDAVVNAGALWIFGDNVEDRLGRARFLLLFVAGATVGSLLTASLAVSTLQPLVGAAGGVGAVAGAHLILLRPARVLLLVPARPLLDLIEVPSALIVLAWVVVVGAGSVPLQGSPMVPAAAVTAAAGLVTGALLARLLARRDRLACAWWNVPNGQFSDRRRTSRDTSASSVSSASN